MSQGNNLHYPDGSLFPDSLLFPGGLDVGSGTGIPTGTGFTLVVPGVAPTGVVLPTDGSDTGVIPGAPPDLVFDTFWRPGSAGNGRIWISGNVTALSSNIEFIEWRVNNSSWVRAETNLVPGDRFGFYITGNEPSLWGTEEVSNWFQPLGGTGYYAQQVSAPPVFFLEGGVMVTRADNFDNMVNQAYTWWYEDGFLYFHTPQDFYPGFSQALLDPVFKKGQTYHVEIRAEGDDVSADPTTFVDETFVWQLTVRDQVSRFLRTVRPSWLQDSAYAETLYIMIAKQTADLYALFEDVMTQFFPQTVTWGIQMWESQIGLPTVVGLTLDQRRQFLVARRQVAPGSRTAIFQTIQDVAGAATLIDSYDQYRVDLKLAGSPDPDLRRALETLVGKIKPTGIDFHIDFAAFIAGISRAGDTL